MYVIQQFRHTDVIAEKPNVQIDEPNAIPASGENGDSIANLKPTDPNVNRIINKMQQILETHNYWIKYQKKKRINQFCNHINKTRMMRFPFETSNRLRTRTFSVNLNKSMLFYWQSIIWAKIISSLAETYCVWN